MAKTITITAEFKIRYDRIQDLIDSALSNGGSDYWCKIEDYVYPNQSNSYDESLRHIEFPLKGGAIILSSIEDLDEKIRLTMDSIMTGLQCMAEKYPKHFADFISENDDMYTGDVFLQCCLFGEVRYG